MSRPEKPPLPLSFGIASGLAIAIAVVAVYQPVWSAPYLWWDDDLNIWLNPVLVKGTWWYFWAHPYYGMYIPVTYTAWTLLYHLGAGAVWPFRAFNLGLHIANAGLVAVLAHKYVGRFSSCETPPSAHRLFALGAGLLFALHPVQVAAVAWISGGRDLLAAFFALAATSLLLSERRGLYWELSTCFFGAALLSKPGVVALPVAIAAVALVITPHVWRERRRLGGQLLLWALLSLVVSVVTFVTQAPGIESQVPLWFRPAVALDSYGFLLLKVVAPASLAADYGRTPGLLLERPSLILWTSAAVASWVAGLLWLSRRHREYLLGLGWPLLLAPVAGFVPSGYQTISTVADHYQYLPLAILSVLLCLVLQKLAGSGRAARAALAAGLCVALVILGASSWSRARVWSNNDRFFSDMVANNPTSYAAAIGLGNVACEAKADYERGLRWFEVAFAQRPFDPPAVSGRAFCLMKLKRFADILADERLLQEPTFLERAMLVDLSAASFVASLGVAAAELGDLDKGLFYSCLARNAVDWEPVYSRNVQLVRARFRRYRGTRPECPTGVTLRGVLEANLRAARLRPGASDR